MDGAAVVVAATAAVEGVEDEAKEVKEGAALVAGVATEEVNTGEAVENDKAAADKVGTDEVEVPKLGEEEGAADDEDVTADGEEEAGKEEEEEGLGAEAEAEAAAVDGEKRLAVVAADEADEEEPKAEKSNERMPREEPAAEEGEDPNETGTEEKNGAEEAAGVWDWKEKPWDCAGGKDGKENDGDEVVEEEDN